MANTFSIAVDNLKCHGCANTITKGVSKVIGVENVEVDIEQGIVSVSGQETCSKDQILQVLSKMGYPERGTTTDLQKVKSYVSCAVGRIS